MVRTILLNLVWILAVSSCVPIDDFDRAIHVGDAVLPDVPVVQNKGLIPAKGKFIFAVPNGVCSPIDSGIIRFEIESGGEDFIGSFDIADLTWSHAHGSCDSIGYLDLDASNKLGARDFIASLGNAVSSVKLDMSEISVSEQRKVMIWVIYGDRVPSEKIWEINNN